MIELEKIILRKLKMRLKHPFTTSFGTFQDKEFFLVEAISREGTSGFGESVAFTSPWYSEETVETNEHVMRDFLIPLLFESPLKHPNEITSRFQSIRRNNMAKSALEGAVWDLYARQEKMSLSTALGGHKAIITVGVSLGIQRSVDDLLTLIQNNVDQGYKRIKVKIKPGWDIDVIREVRNHFPSIPLMADANSAYTLTDIEHLKQLDEFELMMIEQPLAHDDIIHHAKLQAQMATPICLDESIHSLEDAKNAIELGSCKIINIKIGRVGGLTESVRIHDFCKAQNVPVWCGGMLEAGIGRAHNIALTTLGQFILPGDTASSSHYWEKDIIYPEVIVKNGVIDVPNTPGLGYEINWDAVDQYTVDLKEYKN